MGYTFQSQKSFFSIHGLAMYIDPRFGVTFYPTAGDTVKTLTEISDNEHKWNQNNSGSTVRVVGITLPNGQTGKAMRAYNVGGQLKAVTTSDVSRLAFLRNGSPFSIYILFQITAGASGVSNYFRWITGGGFVLDGNPYHNGKYIRIAIANDSINALSFQTPAHAYAYSTWSLMEINHRGYNVVGNDCEIYVNDVLKASGNWSAPPGVTPQGYFNLMNPNMGTTAFSYNALTLIYNHTGKAESIINADRQSIRQVITRDYGI